MNGIPLTNFQPVQEKRLCAVSPTRMAISQMQNIIKSIYYNYLLSFFFFVGILKRLNLQHFTSKTTVRNLLLTYEYMKVHTFYFWKYIFSGLIKRDISTPLLQAESFISVFIFFSSSGNLAG